MSIIDEALKKTQQELHMKQARADHQKNSQAQQNIEQILQQSESKSRRSFPLIFLILFTLLLALLVMQTLHPYKKKQHASAMAQADRVSSLKPTATVPSSAVVLQGLKLQGIMASDHHRIALINQSTYRVGDELQGLTVKSIDDDQVVLQHGKLEYHLKLTA